MSNTPLTPEQLAAMNGRDSAYASSGVMMPNGFECGTLGLTKREHIATLLLAGIFANDYSRSSTVDGYAQNLAVKHADLLLRRLQAEPEIPAPPPVLCADAHCDSWVVPGTAYCPKHTPAGGAA